MVDLASVFEELVDDLAKACGDVYADRLVSVAVFGSVATGMMRPDSDIDILIVVDPLPDGRLRRVEEFEKVEVLLQARRAAAAASGVHTRLAPIFKTPAELDYGSPLLLDMTEHVRILTDPQATLARRLERLRQRLIELGSRKVQRDGGYYWLLKPDYKPGEVIEL
jgi:predicted nucleotidyltransferase